MSNNPVGAWSRRPYPSHAWHPHAELVYDGGQVDRIRYLLWLRLRPGELSPRRAVHVNHDRRRR